MKPIPALVRAGAVLRAQTNDIHASAAIEVALTLPVLVIFLFGIIAFGSAMWQQNALDYSVAEAARCASVNTAVCGTKSDIESYAASRSGARFPSGTFSYSTQSCGNQVSASYTLPLTIPTLTLSITLDAQACYPT